MHNIIIQILAAFIPNKQKRKAFRKKYKRRTPSFDDLNRGLNYLRKINVELSDEINDLKVANKYIANLLIDLYLDNLIQKRENSPFNLTHYLSNITQAPEYLCVDSTHNYLNLLLNVPGFTYKYQKFNIDNTLISWEIARWPENVNSLLYSIQQNKDILFIGDSFLRSINTFADEDALEKYKKGISFGIDDLGYYYDATRPTRMEMMLNDKNLTFTKAELERARKCIDRIVKNHLTKYNSQPIFTPNIGRQGVKKILVIDQSYGDMSIAKGWGSEETFKNMLQAAIDENPNADIIIKTHPDTMAGRGGYYTGIKAHDNIYTQTEPINPISLIQYCDKVYVCTTQFGFEALMCGKETHVFGMPFYAGWGLTHDQQTCPRRTNKRSLEEVFYIAYILYSYYVNPKTGQQCEIEEAMDYLLKLREEYFEKYNIRNES